MRKPAWPQLPHFGLDHEALALPWLPSKRACVEEKEKEKRPRYMLKQAEIDATKGGCARTVYVTKPRLRLSLIFAEIYDVI